MVCEKAPCTLEMMINLSKWQKLLEGSQHHIQDTFYTDKSNFRSMNTEKIS